ncbi:MAG: hypothetical protein PHC80_07175 [Eubacteriales bacterium]|nr:hypothetical protein [Eubacteriales bacterium]
MTITNANGDYPKHAAFYEPQMNRPADMPMDAARFDAFGSEPAEPFGIASDTGNPALTTFDLPYELDLRGGDVTPQLRLYRPAQPKQAPLPQIGTPGQIPAVQMPGGQENGEGAKTMAEINEETQCPVCDNRKYQDGSNDPGVSLKFATKLNPYSATAAIRAHEYQHVRHHQMEADKQDRKIISQTVMLRTRRCPCCGKMYTAGGVTKTVTAAYKDCAHSNTQAEGESLDACV